MPDRYGWPIASTQGDIIYFDGAVWIKSKHPEEVGMEKLRYLNSKINGHPYKNNKEEKEFIILVKKTDQEIIENFYDLDDDFKMDLE